MLLAVDAGNSRIKWGIHDGGWRARGGLETARVAELDGQWGALDAPGAVLVANVAGEAVERALRDAFERRGWKAHFAAAQRECCGVRNGYRNPQQLGVDRWLALIAAWRRQRSAAVVVGLGTAATMDALDHEGNFLGGLIVPGYRLMLAALAGSTAALTAEEGQPSDFPGSTPDAMTSGAIDALAGAAQRLADRLRERTGRAPALLLGGGDAELLAPRLGSGAQVVDNLVLEGLVAVSELEGRR